MEISEIYSSAANSVSQIRCTSVSKNGTVLSGVAEDWNNNKVNKQWVAGTSGGSYALSVNFNVGTLKPWEFCVLEIVRDDKSIKLDGMFNIWLNESGTHVYILCKSWDTVYVKPYNEYSSSAVDIHKIRMFKVSLVKELQVYNETCSQQYLTCSSFNYSATTKTIGTLHACLTSSTYYDSTKEIQFSTTTATESKNIIVGSNSIKSIDVEVSTNSISLSNKVPESFTAPMRLIGVSEPPMFTKPTPKYVSIYQSQALDINSIDVPCCTVYKLNHALPMVTPPSASITSLEPNNVPQLISNAITVSWEANPFDRCYVDVGQLKYGPLKVKSLTIPANTLDIGNTSIKLTVYPYANIDLGVATATATFLVYGPPKMPVLNVDAETYSNIPTIAWSGTGQVAYEVQILQGTTVKQQSGTVVSDVQSYKCSILSAGTYTVKVRIRNEYNLWSEWAEATFKIKEAIIAKPVISQVLQTTKPSAIVFYSVTEDATKVEVLKRKQDRAWEVVYSGNAEDRYEDIAVGSNVYEYKIRVYVDESSNESEASAVNMEGSVKHFNFTTLSTYKRVQLIYEPEINKIPNFDISLTQYQGRKGPIAERGEVNYNSYSFNFMVDENQLKQFENVLYANEDIFYCDHRGNEGYLALSNVHISADAVGWYGLSFSATEVSI